MKTARGISGCQVKCIYETLQSMWKKDTFKGKTILITGGTGSFGQAAANHLLSHSKCKKIIIFSRDEWKQWQMQQDNPLFASERMRYFLGDVRDQQRLSRAFRGVDYVIHAAALKQVPAAEYNPTEFIKTNILSANGIIDEAINQGVEKIIALSTDKAVNPVNLYGATKLCSEKLFIAGNAYVGSSGKPRISIVRYGNVLGTRGSILSAWQKALANGAKEIPITDARMTRFWISIDSAVKFTLNALRDMQGEEIFIPKIPSCRVKDLASAIAPNIPIKTIGIREGEKLHEFLISQDESRFGLENRDYYFLLPPIHRRSFEERVARQHQKGTILPDDFSLTSVNNPDFLDVEGSKALIRQESIDLV